VTIGVEVDRYDPRRHDSVSRDAQRSASGHRNRAPLRVAANRSKGCPMIVAYHVIFGTYGFWLPNDPRGSWSDFVGAWDLFRYGHATKTAERRSVASHAHNRELRREAKRALKFPPVILTGLQARAVARGFAKYAKRSGLIILACAIMHDHIHLVLGRAHISVEQVVIQLKGAAVRQLREEGIEPASKKCFARGEWKVFLDLPDVDRAIEYVDDNPEKEGLRRQTWNMVTRH
jgi:REP element-mobilizing transposase RayT